ncbi:nuclear nucleic acid-binding protein C1D-like [Littorina saxatilis]|uniref:Nuclear nucleic acid-binding protein C1D n=1 Tax=Littorina saxatilis TaxID=31220 RepID=A0AAN9BCW9_9CAEN
MESSDNDGIPIELKERLGNFDAAVSQVESMLQPLISTPHNELVDKLAPLDAAKLDLVGVYSINSLFWMYLNVCGVNPKDHPVKKELERIRSYMTRIKEAQDSLNKPRVDKGAAKRFVRSALWQASQAKASGKDSAQEQSASQSPQPQGLEESGRPTGRKRRHKD